MNLRCHNNILKRLLVSVHVQPVADPAEADGKKGLPAAGPAIQPAVCAFICNH